MTHSQKKRQSMESNPKGDPDSGISNEWFESSYYNYDQGPKRKYA